jgi:hypothetical protein
MKKINPMHHMNKSAPDHRDIISYLYGSIDSDKQRFLEEQLTEDEFFGDAIEGLKSIASATELNAIHKSLSYSVKRNLKKTKSKKPWEYPMGLIVFTLILILSLIVASYWIILQLSQ